MQQRPREIKPITCKCGNPWLEEMKVAKFNGESVTTLEQAPQVLSAEFFVYRCPACNDINLPKVFLNTFDAVRKEYDEMLDAMEDYKLQNE